LILFICSAHCTSVPTASRLLPSIVIFCRFRLISNTFNLLEYTYPPTLIAVISSIRFSPPTIMANKAPKDLTIDADLCPPISKLEGLWIDSEWSKKFMERFSSRQAKGIQKEWVRQNVLSSFITQFPQRKLPQPAEAVLWVSFFTTMKSKLIYWYSD